MGREGAIIIVSCRKASCTRYSDSAGRVAEAHNPNPSFTAVPDTKHRQHTLGRADVTVGHLTVPPISVPADSSTLADTASRRLNVP